LNKYLGLQGYIDISSTRYVKDDSLPDSFDWRSTQHGTCILPVRSQLDCGSCYAFASTGVLADRSCLAYGYAPEFSPTAMILCNKNTNGCNGGSSYYSWN